MCPKNVHIPSWTFLCLALVWAFSCSSSGGSFPDADMAESDVGVVDMVVSDDGSSPDLSNDIGNDLSSEVMVDRNLTYTLPAGINEADAKLDVHYRVGEGGKRLVFLVHGGSWVSGDKGNFESSTEIIGWWLERGYVVVNLNFRLASRLGQPRIVTPMDQASDIAHAIAWIDARKDDYGVSAHGALLFGYSSGAHLVALLGADGRYMQEVGLTPEYIAATISADVHAYDVPFALELMVGSVVEQNIPFIQHVFGSTEEEQLEASPISYTDGYVAPALLLSVEPSPEEVGSHGYLVSQTAQRYRSALEAAGHTASAAHFNEETHTTLVVDFGGPTHGPTQAVQSFLDGLTQ